IDVRALRPILRDPARLGCPGGRCGRLRSGMSVALTRSNVRPLGRTLRRGRSSGILATPVNNSSGPSEPGTRPDESQDPHRRFEEARSAEALSRIQRASFLLLLPLALALAVNVRVFDDSMPIRALALIGMLGLAAVTHVVVGQRFAGRRAIPIAVAFVL